MAARDLYEILGVEKDADQDTIKRAYRRKARQLHPDAGGTEDGFKELTTAYEVLRNPRPVRTTTVSVTRAVLAARPPVATRSRGSATCRT
jgi:hypothetical protein